MPKMKHRELARPDIEYTLEKSRWHVVARRCWQPIGRDYCLTRVIKLGDKRISFEGGWPSYSYSKLTPAIWTELTGLQFHRREK